MTSISKPKVFLHGGMHKTGTTSLQHALYRAKDCLLEEGVFYPDIGCPHHNQLFSLRSKYWSPESIVEQLDLARRKSANKVIFSAEVVSILRDDEIQSLSEIFSDYDFTLLMTFRHWCDFLPSRWSQNCMVRDAQPFSQYIEQLKHFKGAHPDICFGQTLERFNRYFPKQVMALSYSNLVNKGKSVLSEICDHMELSKSTQSNLFQNIQPRKRQLNYRLDWQAIELCRLTNEALSEHLNLNENDLFESLGTFGNGNISYGLRSKDCVVDLQAIEGDFLLRAEKMVKLRSSDNWIKALSNEFETNYASYFSNLESGKIFYGDFSSITTCTDLTLSDIESDAFRKSIRHFCINDFL